VCSSDLDRVILRIDKLSSINEFISLLPVAIEPSGEQQLYIRRILSESEVHVIKQYFECNRLTSPYVQIFTVINSPVGLISKNDDLTYFGEIANPIEMGQ
jgi:hypothetical protein